MTGPGGRTVGPVAISETPHGMRSDVTSHRARWVPDPDGDGQRGAWLSTRLGERRCTAAEARASLVLAELETMAYDQSPAARQLREQLGISA